MNLLILRTLHDCMTFAVVNDEIMKQILDFNKKTKHHVSNLEYINPDDRKKFALNLLGIHDDSEPMIGDNIFSISRNEYKSSSFLAQCDNIYLL